MLNLDNKVKEYFQKNILLVNQAIKSNLDEDFKYRLKEASNYAVYPDGHRYRSIIGLELYEMLGGDKFKFMDSAVGIEFIHHASMTCDDLPCMDNSFMRKGKLAVHKKYGEDTAILSGLHSWNKGMHLIYSNALNHFDNPDYLKEVFYLVDNAIEQMLEGQEMDLRKKKTIEEFMESIKKKNILFNLACILPAYLLDRKEHLESLKIIGEEFSIGYQLYDDLRDAEQDPDSDKNNSVYFFGKKAVMQKIKEIKKTSSENIIKIKPDSKLVGMIDVVLKAV